MKQKAIAIIILVIILCQTFGSFSNAFVSGGDNSTQEVNSVMTNSVNEVDNKTKVENVTNVDKNEKNEVVSVDKNEKSEETSVNKVETSVQTSIDKTETDKETITNKTKVNNIASTEEADPENINENTNIEIENQYITEDDLLYSNKYLVKDKVVSRIDPKTTISEFKQKVEVAKDNKLSFYKKDGTTQLTEGILGTGMIVRGTNGQEYVLSVKGDITGEGEANQVELTMMIRHLIELQGWKLEDINATSGDITGDGDINLVDINKMIKHIVFGDWEYDDRTTPNPPTIEVLGNEGDEVDSYTSEVRVRIVEDKSTQNLKTTYKVSGTLEKEESSIAENEQITIAGDGEYLITAYTYGIQGNRSKASNRKIVISKIDEPDEPQEPERPDEPDEPDEPEVYNITYELNGGTNNSENPATYTYGSEVVLKDPSKEGYTFKGWYKEAEFTNKIEKIEATQRGDVTVYAKWEANIYNIAYELNGGTNNSENPDTYEYGTETILKDPTKEGYTFKGWYKEAEFTNKIEKIEATQRGDVTVYAKWEQNEYKITGEAKEGGTIENAEETVKYGENSVKQIKITPDINKCVDSITINGVSFTQYEEDEETGIVTLPIFENVTEDKHVVVMFRQLEIVATIVDAPAGYENLIGREYVSIKRALKDITVDGVTIQLIADTKEEFIVTNYQIKLDLNGKNIIGNKTTATIESGNLTLINSSTQGKIVSSTESAVYVKNGGTFTLGENEGTVQIDNIIIQGETKGVKTEGIFNFYDGTIIGTKAIEGEVSEVPVKYNVSIGEEDTKQVATLKIMAGAEAAIAQKTFFKLEDAIAYANEEIATDGSQVEITVINNLQKTETVNIASNKNIKLNLNGYEVNFVNGDNGIINSGKLEIVDTKGEGKITSTMTTGIKNNTKAELTINSGIMEVAIAGTNYQNVRKAVSNYGLFTINGGSIQAVNSYNIGIENQETGKVNINGGNIQGNSYYSIYELGKSTLTVNDGTINGPIYANNQTNIEIKGGTITGTIVTYKDAGIEIEGGIVKGSISGNKISITGGTFTAIGTTTENLISCSVANINEKIDLNISGGTFDSEKNIISIKNYDYNNMATINITGGIFTAKGNMINTNSFKGITNINIENATITTQREGIILSGSGQYSREISIKNIALVANGVAIKSSGYILNIKEDVNIKSNESYGIYNGYSNQLFIGEKDGNVNNENIIIEGKTYGIYNEIKNTNLGKVNFYDGKVIGNLNCSIYGNINDVEEGYTITKTVEDTKEIAILEMINNFKVVETNMLYNTLQEAIDDINTEEKQTIQLINNKVVPVLEVTTIPNDKNILLDLNGYTLELGGIGAIDNSGTLEITDSSENKTSIINMFDERSIINEEGATLEINGGTLKESKSNSTMIENKGTIKINDGTLQANNSNITIISNTGILEMDGGIISEVSSSSVGIRNQEDGNMTIKGGTITLKNSSSTGIINEGTGGVLIEGGEIIASIKNTGAGTVTVEGGKITGDAVAIYNYSNGYIIVNGGTIEANGLYGSVINNSGSLLVTGGTLINGGSDGIIKHTGTGTVTVTGGTLTSSRSKGIYNCSTGTVNITGGTLILTNSGDSYGIYNQSTGIINIGNKDGNVSVSIPEIRTNKYGIYNASTGVVNFYDGVIIGNTNQSIYGSINETEEEYEIVKTNDESTKKETAKLEKVVSIINTTSNAEYYDIQKAVMEAEKGDTLQVVRNVITLSSQDSIVVETDKDVVLDLNGYNINFGQADAIANKGKLSIEDNSSEKTGSIINTVGKIITNEEGAILEINEGTITGSKSNCVIIENKGTMKVNGGAIQANNSDITIISNIGILEINGGKIQSSSKGVVGIKNQEEGNVTINNGTIQVPSNEIGIDNVGIGEVIIEGGEIIASINNSGTGTIKIEGGIIKGNGNRAIWNKENGYIVVNGGTVQADNNGDTVIRNEKAGSVVVTGGIVQENYNNASSVIRNETTGSVVVTGGMVIAKKGGSSGIIYNRSTGTVTVTGGTLTSSGEVGIYNASAGTVTITGGTVTSTKVDYSYGIRNGSTGTITIGEKGGNVSTSIPEIKANEYGIYNSSTGKVNFYDGIIVGKTNQSIYGSINEIEEDYEIVKINDETTGMETAQLAKETSIINTTSNIEYYDIQKAITEAEKGDTLQVKRDLITLLSQDSIVVETDKDVVLDLNGYNINFGQINAIINKGKLSIEDSSSEKTGSIINTTGEIITNEEGATLEINGGTTKGTTNNKMIENKGTMKINEGIIQAYTYSTTIISNIGSLEMNGGKIESGSQYYQAVVGIKNQNEGNVTIKNGTISSYSSGVVNEGTGGVIIEGGEINSSIKNSGIGTVTVEGGTITIQSTAIYNEENGSIIVNGGTIQVNQYPDSVIKNKKGGSVLVTGGTLTIENGSYYKGIIHNCSSGTVTVTGGTLTSTGSKGIYNEKTGTVTIGTKDGNVSTSIPEIKANGYGIYNASTGEVNFYDGIIRGGAQAINGEVADVETDYEIRYSENNTIATLQPINTGIKFVSIGNIYYDKLQTAVNESVDGDVITLWSDIILETTVEIPEGRNITIELNGYNITGYNLDVLINNRGTVNIQDAIGTGSISNPDGETIVDIN